MQRTIVYLMAALAGAAFLYMVKLMNDMTDHMARMTEQVSVMSGDVGRMSAQMQILVEQVGGIKASVGHMEGLAADVHGLRENVAAMAGVIHKGGEQIQQLNPMQMMDRMMEGMGQPGGRMRRETR